METHTSSHSSACNLQLQDGGAMAGVDLVQQYIPSPNHLLGTYLVSIKWGVGGPREFEEVFLARKVSELHLVGRRVRLQWIEIWVSQTGKTKKTKAPELGPQKSKVACSVTGELQQVKPSSILDTKPRLRSCDLIGSAERSHWRFHNNSVTWLDLCSWATCT